MIVNVKSGLSIYDYSNILLGGFDSIIKGLIQQNEGMSLDTVLTPTQELTYDESYYVSDAPQIELPEPKVVSTTKYLNTKYGQSIYDLNLMCYSGFDNIIQFIRDNDINSINDQLLGSMQVNFNTTINNNLSLRAVIDSKRLIFATCVEYNYRITEGGEDRITEDGDARIT